MGLRPHEEELVKSLVGRRIVAATWADHSPDHDWTGHEYALLELDDGRVVEFHAIGHDAWGATVGTRGDLTVPEAEALNASR